MRRINHKRDDRGATMAEAALILPVLVLLLFGTVEFSRAFNAKNTLNQAAREGVREYALTQDFDAGSSAAIGAATSLDADALAVSATACSVGDPTALTVTYPFAYDIPFFGAHSLTLSSTAVMRCGG